MPPKWPSCYVHLCCPAAQVNRQHLSSYSCKTTHLFAIVATELPINRFTFCPDRHKGMCYWATKPLELSGLPAHACGWLQTVVSLHRSGRGCRPFISPARQHGRAARHGRRTRSRRVTRAVARALPPRRRGASVTLHRTSLSGGCGAAVWVLSVVTCRAAPGVCAGFRCTRNDENSLGLQNLDIYFLYSELDKFQKKLIKFKVLFDS